MQRNAVNMVLYAIVNNALAHSMIVYVKAKSLTDELTLFSSGLHTLNHVDSSGGEESAECLQRPLLLLVTCCCLKQTHSLHRIMKSVNSGYTF